MFIHLRSDGLTYAGPDTVFSEYMVMGKVNYTCPTRNILVLSFRIVLVQTVVFRL